jgi:hypothetical protein
MFIGTYFSGFVVDNYAGSTGHNWTRIWFVPAYIAMGVLIYFILFFREKKSVSSLRVSA